jgi:SAM-dependent methyltransferase
MRACCQPARTSALRLSWTGYDHISLNTLIGRLREGKFVVPDFQREFEWKPWDVRELMRSIFRDYYMGSLLLWKGKKETFRALSCENIYAFDGTARPEYIVLDGQQRLTAIHYAFFAPNVPLPTRQSPFFYFIRVDRLAAGGREHWKELVTRLSHLWDRVEAVVPRMYAGQAWLLGVGIDLRASNYLTLDDVLEMRGAALKDGTAVSLVLAGAWHALHNEIDKRGQTQCMPPGEYQELLNHLLAEEHVPFRLRDGVWVGSALSDTEVLRRVLLENADEALACKQGDVQVEMVVSTVQTKLSRAGAVVVDYGAGVGRVLAGLATAENFKTATYVAVDEPMLPEVKALAGRTGAKSEFIAERAAFLASKRAADAILVVNTLHHIPFREIVGQLGALFGKLSTGGFLLIHEMGRLKDPEQRNVPWRTEDLIALFNGAEFECNARSTVSRSGVPLCHAIITPTGKGVVADALSRNVATVWSQMKARTLDEITTLYTSKDPSRHIDLEYELITNANLDLNRP